MLKFRTTQFYRVSKKQLIKDAKSSKQNGNNTSGELHDIKNDTSKDKNVFQYLMITDEEHFLRLEK